MPNNVNLNTLLDKIPLASVKPGASLAAFSFRDFSFSDFSFSDFSFSDCFGFSDFSFDKFTFSECFSQCFSECFGECTFQTLVAPSNGVLIKFDPDVKTIYENLNKVRQKYRFATVTIPAYPAGTRESIEHYNNLKDLIAAMSSNAHIGNNASLSGLTIPTSGSIVKYSQFTDLNTVLNRIQDNCISFNGSNNP